MSCKGCSLNNTNTLANGYDWLIDLPEPMEKSDIVEVKFKSTRKEYFKNIDNIPIKRGDCIVVATSPGHDVGVVTLTGYLAEKQFKTKIKNQARYNLNTVYRKATESDIEKLEEARGREKETMIRARQIAEELGLGMKIGDVEYRGDSKKAIFYYIAEGRVDFRELIRIYARDFRIKIEMKQIGARQEAGLIGGIGSCGRELCCSSWRTDFSSISSEAALKQGLSPSAQKMAGACGKLKCCLVYELDTYIEAGKEFPRELLNIELEKGTAKPFKTDVLHKEIWYGLEGSMGTTFKLSLEQVKTILQQNKRGITPKIDVYTAPAPNEETKIQQVTLDGELDRFDNKKPQRKNRRRKNGSNNKPNVKARTDNNSGKGRNNNPKKKIENSDEKKAGDKPRNNNRPKRNGNPKNQNRRRPPKKQNSEKQD